jgi:hypothetical protein
MSFDDVLLSRSGAGVMTGPAPESSIRIVETDGDVVELLGTTAHGEINIVISLQRDGTDLLLTGLHIDGPGRGAVGLSMLRELARMFGRQYHVSRVIVQGGIRTTGAHPGRVPRPIIIEIGDH